MWEPGCDNRGYVGVTFKARTIFELNQFNATWSDVHNCWVSPADENLLLLVHEIWIDNAKDAEMDAVERVPV